jgi:integrase
MIRGWCPKARSTLLTKCALRQASMPTMHGGSFSNAPLRPNRLIFLPEAIFPSLSPTEIRIMLKLIEKVATLPTIRLGMRLYLQTMVRKSELQDATWDEVDFENAVWTIPKERMKRRLASGVGLA